MKKLQFLRKATAITLILLIISFFSKETYYVLLEAPSDKQGFIILGAIFGVYFHLFILTSIIDLFKYSTLSKVIHFFVVGCVFLFCIVAKNKVNAIFFTNITGMFFYIIAFVNGTSLDKRNFIINLLGLVNVLFWLWDMFSRKVSAM